MLFPLLIDVALAAIALETVILLVRWYGRGAGLRPIDVVAQLLAGACLLLALRCSVHDAPPEWTFAFFAASLPAHLFDLVRRARRTDEG